MSAQGRPGREYRSAQHAGSPVSAQGRPERESLARRAKARSAKGARAPLHVETTGQGPPLVLLHGWAMHSGMWGPLLPRLAQRFRVHAVDLPGHGHSAPPRAFTLDGVVAALAAAFPAGPRPLTVLGWSLGGLDAMRWARLQAPRVGRLVLVATSPRFVGGDGWPHAMSDATLARFGDELHVDWKLAIQRFLALQMLGSEHGRATLAELRSRIFARGEPSPKALLGALATIRGADLREEITRVAQPVLVVSGARDTLALPAAGRWLAEHLPKASFAQIDGAAHAPFLSHAAAFAAAVDAFLDGR
jgi:pimeloyl-[acyl-carrier protein] methyl ester esterase